MTIVINKINHTIEVSNGDKIVMSVPQVQVVSVGIQGPQGIQGTTGADGAAGEGIPLAGASGSFLYKSSGDDYDSAWSDNLLWDSTNKLLTVQASSFGSYKPTVSVRNASGQKEVELQQGQMAGYGGTITCYDGVDGANYVRLVYSAGYPKLSTTHNNITFETIGGARLRLGGSYISYDFNDNLDRLSVNAISPTVQIDSRNSTHVGLLVKGATSQTANLQEWQNSSGVVKGSVNNAGSAVFANGTFNHSTASVPGALLVRDFHPDTGGYAVMELAATNFPSGKGLVFYSNTQQIQTTGTFIATGSGAGTGYFGGTGDPTSVQDQVRISASGGNAFLYTMKYASSPYPKLVISASGYSIRTKAGAWADLEGYGEEVIGINTSGNVTMTAAGPAILPLCVKGAVSQSANLQEWQDSSGNVVGSINPSGRFESKATGYQSVYFGLNPTTGSHGVWGSTYGAGYFWGVLGTYGSGATNQGNQGWRSTGTVGTGVYGDLEPTINTLGIRWNNDTRLARDSGGGLLVTSTLASAKILTVKGAAGQTANLQEWQNSSGTVLASIGVVSNFTGIWLGQTTPTLNNYAILDAGNTVINDKSQLHLRSGNVTNICIGNLGTSIGYGSTLSDVLANVSLHVKPANSSYIPLVCKGLEGQSVNLQEWQDSNGTAVAAVKANGHLGLGTNSPDKILHLKGDNISSDIVFQCGTHVTKGYFAHYLGSTLQLAINRRIDGVFSNSAAAAASMNFVGLSNNSYITFYTSNANNSNPTERMRIDSLGRVGINAIAESQLHVTSYTASEQGVIVRGAVGQTANLTEWQNSSGTVVAAVLPGGGLHIKSQDLYRSILLEKNGVGTQAAAITFQSGADSYTMGIEGTRFCVTAGMFVSGQKLIQFGTSAYGRSIHSSDSSNLYGAGGINSEIAPSASYPAYHAIMRGTPAGGEEAIRVTSGPTYSDKVFAVNYDGKIKTNQTSAGTTLGTVTGKMPIYNESGTLIGYIPIYDSIT